MRVPLSAAPLLDIDDEAMQRLTDSQARNLVALLCEADLVTQGISATAVTWGGRQDSSDGGIDVRVESPAELGTGTAIPRKASGFQVKHSSVGPSEIREEMAPGGVLRDSIRALLLRGGAYVIVNSKDSLTDSRHRDRKAAMEQAAADLAPGHTGHVGFMDRSGLASWLRMHPSLVVWFREKVGLPLQGWKSFPQLSQELNPEGKPYLQDEEARILSPNAGVTGVAEGIQEIRSAMRRPGAVVRLVGLSGMGKTRLVQALFEEVVGSDSLPPNEMIYTDLSDNPDPPPSEMVRRALESRSEVVLVIDNCPPEVHRKLSKQAKLGGNVRLLTVEYDVQGEKPEETQVFRLEPASDRLIRDLIRQRNSHLHEDDCRVIAEASGGNARLALALAAQVRPGESLRGLNQSELFDRLFYPRGERDRNLLRVAQACSLVYSFQLVQEDGFSAELAALARLVEVSPFEFYGCVSDLRDRGLVQTRGRMAALLPQAIAHRLAKQFLDRVPDHLLSQAFPEDTEMRLFYSFAHRLGFLEDCPKAKEIARRWIAPEGLLFGAEYSPYKNRQILRFLAPILQEELLEVVGSAPVRQKWMQQGSLGSSWRQELAGLLRYLAYRPQNFEKAMDLLLELHAAEPDPKLAESLFTSFGALICLWPSGTLAPPEQKLEYLWRKLDASRTAPDQAQTLKLLSNTLEVIHAPHFNSYEFGGRVGIYGYRYSSIDEMRSWFRELLIQATARATSDAWCAEPIRRILAEKFRGLWERIQLKDELEVAALLIGPSGSWMEGYAAIGSVLSHGRRFGGPRYTEEDFARLARLQAQLAPATLEDKARLVLSKGFRNTEGIEAQALQLGRDLGCSLASLPGILRWTGDVNLIRADLLGRGVSETAPELSSVWAVVDSEVRDTPSLLAEYFLRGLLAGFLARHPTEIAAILDGLVSDSRFARLFPDLQIDIPFDDGAFDRLMRSCALGEAHASMFMRLGHGQKHRQLDDHQLVQLLTALTIRPEGRLVALEILSMRFYQLEEGTYRPSKELLDFGIDLLFLEANAEESWNDHVEHEIGAIARTVFEGPDQSSAAKDFSVLLARRFGPFSSHRLFPQVAPALAAVQPIALLDGLSEGLNPETIFHIGYGDLAAAELRRSQDLLELLDGPQVLEWCRQNPEIRFRFLARFARMYALNTETNRVDWLPMVAAILDEIADPANWLEIVRSAMNPSVWGGNLSEIHSQYLPLFESLTSHPRSAVAEWSIQAYRDLTAQISEMRLHERRDEEAGQGRFE